MNNLMRRLGIIIIGLSLPLFIAKTSKIQAQDTRFKRTGEGTVSTITFYSKSLQMERNVQIYLPGDYDAQGDTRYPVIYYLHGAGQTHVDEPQLFPICNNLITGGQLWPFILIKPDGSCPPWGRSYYTNSVLYGNFEDYIVNDLVEFIDSAYNTMASRDSRAIMGWSMGAYGAMKCALKHPELFCGVAAHAGMLNMRMCSQFIPYLLSENGGAPVSAYSPDAGPWTYGAFAIAGALSPNLDHPPHYVDFPLDSMGNWIDTVWNLWSLENCPMLARNLNQDDDLAIYFDCGTNDEMLAYLFNSSFADSLDNIGIPYIFQIHAGNHNAGSRYPISLTFLDSVLHGGVHPDNIENSVDEKLASFKLSQNYPNPFNSFTTIHYSLAENAYVELTLLDLLGHEIKILSDEIQQIGEHDIEFNVSELPAGIYYYNMQMQVGNTNFHFETRKLVKN